MDTTRRGPQLAHCFKKVHKGAPITSTIKVKELRALLPHYISNRACIYSPSRIRRFNQSWTDHCAINLSQAPTTTTTLYSAVTHYPNLVDLTNATARMPFTPNFKKTSSLVLSHVFLFLFLLLTLALSLSLGQNEEQGGSK